MTRSEPFAVTPVIYQVSTARRAEEEFKLVGPEVRSVDGHDTPSIRAPSSESQRRPLRRRIYEHLVAGFMRDHVSCWANLSRITNLLILLNISLFFLSHLVTREHYYYTIYSVSLLGAVHVLTLLPLGFLSRLWYYLTCLALESVGAYFLVASVWYWVETGRRTIYLF